MLSWVFLMTAFAYFDDMLCVLSIVPLAELQGHRHTCGVGMHQMHNSTCSAAAGRRIGAQLLQYKQKSK